jgi:hypothetical protein
MADKRDSADLAEMVAALISPALIMALVGSLAFFLIEVCYGGTYAGRVRWTAFFFVFGSVLVARISIEMGSVKASVYSLALGAAAFVAMLRFVEYPPGSFLQQFGWMVNLGILALIWWSTSKLTWDCTFIDDSRDASDQSLLEAAGIDSIERPFESPVTEAGAPVSRKRKSAPGLLGWAQRYQQYRTAQEKKPHTPGIWVIYFSLAALPIFGLGQSLVPPEDTSSRQFTFWTMVVYVASGMGLLSTTTFLGLRRYLRQRNLTMPASMAGLWLAISGGLIALFLIGGALLPRPSSEYPLVNIPGLMSKDREASRFSPWDDGEGKDDGDAGNRSSDDGESDASSSGQGKEAGKGKATDNAKKGSGDGKGNASGGKQGDAKGGSKKGDGKGDDAQGKNAEDSKDGTDKGGKKASDNASKGSGSPAKKSAASKSKRNASSRSSSRSPSTPPVLSKIASILKWIIFGILAIVVAVFLIRHGLRFLAQFTQWARDVLNFFKNFWEKLFGRRGNSEPTEIVETPVPIRRRRSFASFANPFDNGNATLQSPADLIKYSFAALEAWAFEHEQARLPQETPLEFADRVAAGCESIREQAPRLANLYAQLAYARSGLPADSRERLRVFWQHLEMAHEEMLTARASTDK